MDQGNLLLVIDMQNDFCLPTGALYIQGAERDVNNLENFIRKNTTRIESIIFTQDTHHVIDISHPGYWENLEGNHPAPFTSITTQDINDGRWAPKFNKADAVKYIGNLEQQGEFPHIIWPEHCIAGSYGAAINKKIMDATITWARQGKYFHIYQKGLNPLTEHFGALRANLPINSDPDTGVNQAIVEKLSKARQIFVSGEARSHCVANTIKQMGQIEGLLPKTWLLEDTMSNVSGFEKLADPIYALAKSQGLRFCNSNKVKL